MIFIRLYKGFWGMRFKGDVISKMATTMQLIGVGAVTRQFLVRTISQSLCRRNAQRYVGQVVLTFSCYLYDRKLTGGNTAERTCAHTMHAVARIKAASLVTDANRQSVPRSVTNVCVLYGVRTSC